MDRMNTIDPRWAWQPFTPSSDRPWNRALAAHLYRRAGFGASVEMLDEAGSCDPAEMGSQLIAQNVETNDFRETADSLAQTILASGDAKKLSAAWVYRLLLTPTQLLEKVTLFWHGHFATSAEKVNDAHMMQRHLTGLQGHVNRLAFVDIDLYLLPARQKIVFCESVDVRQLIQQVAARQHAHRAVFPGCRRQRNPGGRHVRVRQAPVSGILMP